MCHSKRKEVYPGSSGLKVGFDQHHHNQFCLCFHPLFLSLGDVTSRSHDHVASQSDTQELEQQVQSLTSELDASRREVEEFDLVKSDWAMEKEALEEVLLTMREQLAGRPGEEEGEKEGEKEAGRAVEDLMKVIVIIQFICIAPKSIVLLSGALHKLTNTS